MGDSKKDQIKKQRERFYLDQFIAASGRSIVVVQAGEEPDFVLADSDGEFGMELAEVFKDRAEVKPGKMASRGKAIESRRNKLLSRLADIYYGRGGLPLHVQALMPEDFATDLEVLAQYLIDARPTQLGFQGGFSLKPLVSFFIQALPDKMGRYTRWTPVNNSVGWRRRDELDDVQAQVRDKAGKLGEYRLVRPRVALLLHADGTSSSGMISWSSEFGPVDACGFDAVYMYIHPSQSWQLA